ncbi:hypothetical protein [Neisseria sp. Ec49-e6-T10]|uniref:hypothetical protein n=1 Tax=Neisseria sp. Ec49-e6-T10 TaxID=3140744 RepID=UPI003EB7F732
MFYKLKRIYFTVSRGVNKGIDILFYIWRTFLSVLRTIKKTLDAIGYAIAWSLEMFILIVKYSFGFVAVVGVLGALISLLLGFRDISLNLLIAGSVGCVLFFMVAIVAPSIGRVNYFDNN